MEKIKSTANFNNRRQIVELRITVPGHPEKRPKLISYRDLEIRGLTEKTSSRVTGGVYSYKREPASVREARLNLLDALMLEKEKEVTESLGNPSHGITVQYIVDHWQKDHMPSLKIGKRSSVPGWQKLWVDLIGDMPADKLDQFRINEITQVWKEEGLKNATLNARCVALSRVYSWAKKTHRYAKDWNNPFSNAEWFPTTPKVIFLTQEEIEKLIPALKESDTRDLHDAFILALFSGCRSGELFSLTWKHVDMSNGVVRLMERKGGDHHAVNLGPQALQILRDRSKIRVLGNDLVFINPRTGRAYGDLNESLKNALRRAGIEKPGFSWHCLRHTCASLLASEGFSLMEIANHLGHADLKSVQCYAHLAKDHNQITAKALDKRLRLVNL
jgi:integrase